MTAQDGTTVQTYTVTVNNYAGAGTLELAVTQSTPTPPNAPGAPVTFTPLGNIQACPTKDDSWTAGDAQDIAKAPAYDCSTCKSWWDARGARSSPSARAS